MEGDREDTCETCHFGLMEVVFEWARGMVSDVVVGMSGGWGGVIEFE